MLNFFICRKIGELWFKIIELGLENCCLIKFMNSEGVLTRQVFCVHNTKYNLNCFYLEIWNQLSGGSGGHVHFNGIQEHYPSEFEKTK